MYITAIPIGGKVTEGIFLGVRGGSFRGRGQWTKNQRNFKGGSDAKRIINPAQAEGNVTRCRICDSKFHWQHDCPASFENQRKAAGGTQHITLFQYINGIYIVAKPPCSI